MSRLSTYQWISENHQIGIGHNYRSGVDVPFDEPVKDNIALTYSKDDRTQKHYTLFYQQPDGPSQMELKSVNFDNNIQANMLTYCNLGETDYIYRYGTTPLIWRKEQEKGLITLTQEGNAFNPNWMEGGTPPWTGYANFNPVTDFKQKYLAVYPYVVAQYTDSSGVFGETTRDHSVGLYEHFTLGQTPSLPSGSTFKGIAIRYDIVASNQADGRDGLFFLGKICDIQLGTVDFRTSGTIYPSPVPDCYCFPCSDNTLLGSTRGWRAPGGLDIYSMGFVGDRRFLYTEVTPGYLYKDCSKVVISTQGISYEDALAAALAKGFPVLDSWTAKRDFTSFTYDVYMANYLNDHYVSPVIIKKTGEVTNKFKRGAHCFDPDDKDGNNTPNKIFEDEDKNPYDEIPEFDENDPDDIDPNDYADETPLNEVPSFMNPIGKFNRYFALSADDVEDLAAFLSPSADNVWDDILNGLKLYGEDPMNFMLELMAFPFDITDYTGKQQEEITFGRRVHTEINGDIIHDASIVIDLGTCYFKRYHKNFLDYEPYTTAKLYIPYCNEVAVPTSIFLGHYINVKLIVDLSTGGCVGVVSKVQDMDGSKPMSVLYTQGQIGIPIPITAINATEYVKAAFDMVNGAFSSITQIASNGGVMSPTSIATGTSGQAVSPLTGKTVEGTGSKTRSTINSSKVSGGGIAGGFINGLQVAYEFNNQPTPLETTGTGIPYSSFFKPQQCYFIVQSAVPMNVSGYENAIGHACMEYRKLQNGDSYIVAHNPNVQPENATSQETKEINALLATGVWY